MFYCSDEEDLFTQEKEERPIETRTPGPHTRLTGCFPRLRPPTVFIFDLAVSVALQKNCFEARHSEKKNSRRRDQDFKFYSDGTTPVLMVSTAGPHDRAYRTIDKCNRADHGGLVG
jgi:hypothetical protein